MLKPKSAVLFDEPGCGINRAKSGELRKVGCSARALTPGACRYCTAARDARRSLWCWPSVISGRQFRCKRRR
jgi:hypothetical protein